MKRILRIGIMGGTFDPIHRGHVGVAKQVKERFQLDQVLFIPTGDPHFKQGMTSASPQDRLVMTQLAIRDIDGFIASDMEVCREGVTYSVDTLEELSRLHPNDSFFFILASDAATQLHRWYRVERLAQLCDFIVVSRPGYPFDEALIHNLGLVPGLRYVLLDGLSYDVSSTGLREALAAGESVEDWLDPAVAEYIRSHGLYVGHESDGRS
ncbi:MAG: nicotinate-nucleotide adenylyltransferase [Coriobacteriales bacterium]|nr:nicotinate-nucleotide adenylyltransferase [Eggerthellaceae bacterium]MBQ6453062.1 nicotinate-nucleotide adenylyltransferase [Coriobacteriales bacterium]MBQ6586446.1 nicotinate-nucleotide adenylyltransferase [Coriobacteriales bacterium]